MNPLLLETLIIYLLVAVEAAYNWPTFSSPFETCSIYVRLYFVHRYFVQLEYTSNVTTLFLGQTVPMKQEKPSDFDCWEANPSVVACHITCVVVVVCLCAR